MSAPQARQSPAADRREALEMVLTGLVLNLGQVQKQNMQLESESLDFIHCADQLVTFLDAKAGQFSLQDGRLVFAAGGDVETYNANVKDMKERSARLTTLWQDIVTVEQKRGAEADRALRQK